MSVNNFTGSHFGSSFSSYKVLRPVSERPWFWHQSCFVYFVLASGRGQPHLDPRKMALNNVKSRTFKKHEMDGKRKKRKILILAMQKCIAARFLTVQNLQGAYRFAEQCFPKVAA
jgi:hypothetical protein